MRTLVILFSGLFLSGAATAQSLDIFTKTTTEVAPGVYSYGAFSARSLFVVTEDGVIATDPVNSKNAADMRAAIAEVTDQPVKYVVYSHQHWDHVLGGQVFKDEGAEFISHEKCIPHFVRHPNDELVMPDRVIPGDSEITLGDKTLKLMYFGPNHGDCMLVMQVEGTDILYINDLVTPYSVGLGFMPDYDPGEWVRTLHELEAMNGWTQFIGGHGIPIAPKDALVQRRRYMEALMTAVREGIAEGKRLEELYDTIELAQEFQEMRGYDTHIRRGAERIYHFYTMGW
ncbi:MAG: MBL fold metallo-hydrolase [Rhodospirillaceae bacterium]|jgi:glyoxylase-like metal-dependent hydrolase (beta-lactamase superfamily II)